MGDRQASYSQSDELRGLTVKVGGRTVDWGVRVDGGSVEMRAVMVSCAFGVQPWARVTREGQLMYSAGDSNLSDGEIVEYARIGLELVLKSVEWPKGSVRRARKALWD